MNIKSLQEKFAAITEEQGKDLAAAVEAKDIAALEAFCQKRGIELAAEEKGAVAEFFKTGKLPLSDQELENVAGGSCSGIHFDSQCPKCGCKDHYQAPDDKNLRICKQCGNRFHWLTGKWPIIGK